MISLSSLHWPAILVSLLIFMIGGMTWYGPLFGKQWMQLNKLKESELMKDMKKTMIIGTINSLITVFGVALALQLTNPSDLSEAITILLIIWAGFTATSEAAGSIWDRRPWRLFLIHAGYSLLMVLITGSILHLWN